MSGALRHRKLPGMTDEGWARARVLRHLKGMVSLGATFGDIQEINDGGGGARKLRFEIGRDRSTIRFAKGHSVGSGVRPDCLPADLDLRYVAYGASLDAARQIAREGFPRCRRLQIHIYDCNRNGYALGGSNVRCGPDVAIVILERQCVDDGILHYRSAIDVALSECIDGVIGPRYFRLTQRLQKDPQQQEACDMAQIGPWMGGRKPNGYRPPPSANDVYADQRGRGDEYGKSRWPSG